MSDATTILRPARDTDLARVYDVVYANEVEGVPDPPPRQDDVPGLRHLLDNGTLYVAERDGRILAYAGAMTWGRVRFLTDLFAYPDQQSAGLGGALLRRVLPDDGHIRCTFSSTDPRALALYIRAGMQPQWPHFCLRLNGSLRGDAPAGVEVVEGQAGDPEVERWEARIGGRERPADHAYWTQAQRAAPLWFWRRGEVVGYGYARLGARTLWHPDACTLGPIGALTPEDATACVLAAVAWARRHADVLLISVPGAHPALAPLLTAGFHITYVETFLCTESAPFFDARCYIASGSDLF